MTNYYGTKWNAGQPVLCDIYGYPLPPSAPEYRYPKMPDGKTAERLKFWSEQYERHRRDALAILAYGGQPPVIPIDRPSDTEPPAQEETTETEFQYILRKWREFAKAEGRQVP